nr:hypothetical protein [Phycisphaerales bacterium]
NTADDKFGSPGVVASDAFNEFRRSTSHGLAVQVTDRASPTMINAAYNQFQFWDGRADGTFTDPLTGTVVSQARASLENQAIGPILSDVEMAHDARSWAMVADKLARSRPMALAANLPADVEAALADGSSYPTLFARAFGDGVINPVRIGQAMAAYQRTLIADQTPYDRWARGEDPNALTPNQRQGWAVFNAPQSNCNACHTAPTFAGVGPAPFHNLGLRPAAEDLGRQIVTGNPAHRGQMKVPTLRNTGLRTSFMHTGQFTTLTQVIQFYAQAPGAPVAIQDNRSPILNGINIPPQPAGQLQDFLQNALTDPRVAAETFPFDKPQMWSQRPGVRPVNVGGSLAVPGNGPTAPAIIVVDATLIGGPDTRVGLGDAPVGATATLIVGSTAPVNGVISGTSKPAKLVDADGVITERISAPAGTPEQPIYVQWLVTTSQGTGRTAAMRITPICPTGGCPSTCPADVAGANQSSTPDGVLTADDIIVFLGQYFTASPRADIAGANQAQVPDGAFTADDIIVFLGRYFGGC